MIKLECSCCSLQEKEKEQKTMSEIGFTEQNAENFKNEANCQSNTNISVQNQKNATSSSSIDKTEADGSIFIHCDECDALFCKTCCFHHLEEQRNALKKSDETNQESQKENSLGIVSSWLQSPIESLIKALSLMRIICQECQEDSSKKYCQSCEQHLCDACSFKIHNKGKRTKHKLDVSDFTVLKIRNICIIDEDTIHLIKDRSTSTQQNFLKLINQFLQDGGHHIFQETIFFIQKEEQQQSKENGNNCFYYSFKEIDATVIQSLQNKHPFLFKIYCYSTTKGKQFYEKLNKLKDNSLKMSLIEIIKQYNIKENLLDSFQVKVFRQQSQIKLEPKSGLLAPPAFTHNKQLSNLSNFSAIQTVENQSCVSYENNSDLLETSELSVSLTVTQNASIIMMGVMSDRDKLESEKKVTNPQKRQNCRAHQRIYSIREQRQHISANNISTSTQNSYKRKNKKWPIPYLQPYKVSKHDKKNSSQYENEVYLRDLACQGILMLRREKAQQIVIDFQVSRSFVRNIGSKQIQYVSYVIDLISVECLCWVIESIKEDKMTPNEKLILSRIKESFDLKINTKLWESVIKYFTSQQYEADYDQHSNASHIPKIVTALQGEDLLITFANTTWQYQDQSLLNQQELQWNQFKDLIGDYFSGHQQITGGRYGCVQYVKLNGPKPLKQCSLGKLSMYVQEAINKGLIRYHKTLLVSNSEHNTSNNNILLHVQANNAEDLLQMIQIQKDIKIAVIQITLIDILLEAGVHNPISLAQIPLNLKSRILFDVNLIELGFPKLKNMLNTLSEKLTLEITKTHISYEMAENGYEHIESHRHHIHQMNEYFLGKIIEIISHIMMNYQSLRLEDLYVQINNRLGFIFDYKVFNMPDFYQFTIYYCNNYLNVQYLSGVFIVFHKTYQQPAYQNTYQQPAYQNTYQQPAYQNTYQQPAYQNSYQQPTYQKTHHNHMGKNPIATNQMGSNLIGSYQNNHNSNYHLYEFHNQPEYENHGSNEPKPISYIDNSSNNTYSYYSNRKYSGNYEQKAVPSNNYLNEYKNVLSNSDAVYTTIKTPNFKYNNHPSKILWESYDEFLPKEQKYELQDKLEVQEDHDHSIEKIINNVLDEDNISESKSKMSYPHTVIYKEGQLTNPMNNQLYLLEKVTPNSDFEFEEDTFNSFQLQNQKSSSIKNAKQHSRVKSTIEAPMRHERVSSNIIFRK